MAKLDFRNIDWLSPKPSKERAIVGGAVIALALGGYYAFGGGDGAPVFVNEAMAAPAAAPNERQAPARAAAPFQRGSGPGPVALQRLRGGQCSTFAPAGWRISDQNKDGTVFTLTSADGRQTGSYAGVAIGSGQAQGYYGPQFRTPETFTLYAASMLAGEEARPSGPIEQVGAYRAIKFRTASKQGYALVYRFAVPDPGGYGVIMRIAIGRAGDMKSVSVAGAVAAAARCAAVLHPSTGPVYHAPRDTHGTGRTGGGSDSDLAGTYNSQLGTGWVHDPSTGRNYNVDVTTDYHATGPDGPGYYNGAGTKLEPGMS